MEQHMKFLNVGQEVEAKFNSPGFRGAWFLCRILEIKDGRGGEPSCLLKYLNFDDAPTWHRARQPDPAAKPKYWMKGSKTLHWMIRPPAPAVIPECDLEDLRKRAALKPTKEVTVVALFDNEYMVGDMVEWWKDDAWWTGRITELSKTDKGGEVVTLALLPFPHGEGLICGGIKTSKLRPAFSWSRQNQWNLLPPKILEIKDGRGGEPSCLLKYLNFDDAPTWHRARQPDPAAKPKYWMKGSKTLHWMIRPPAPAVIPECDLEDLRKRAALKPTKEVTVVALFDNEYMVGDMVEWWKDDAWWTGRITELSKTDKGGEVVTLALLPFPHGEGLICGGIKTSKLRPAFSWSRQNQWNLLPPKILHKRAGEKPEKPRVQFIYLPGDSSSLFNSQQCGSKDLGSVHSSHQSPSRTMESECKGHLVSLHSECTSEKRRSSSDLTDLVATSSTPYSSNGSRAHEVGKSDCSTSMERSMHRTPTQKRRRSLFNTTSFYVSDSDTDELEQPAVEPEPQQRSAKMRIAIAEGTNSHVSVPGHDGEDKDSGVDTKGTVPITNPPDLHEDTVEAISEKLVTSTSSAEMSLLHCNSTKTQITSCKESSNMEESLVHECLGNRSVKVWLPTENLLEDAEEPQSVSVQETLLGDKSSCQILAEDACREVDEMDLEMEMALDSKRETNQKVVTSDQPTVRQTSGSPGSSQGGNASCSGRADAEICEAATTLVNSKATNKVDDSISENVTSNFSTGTQSLRRTKPSPVVEPSITVQPTKQKQRATKLQEKEFHVKALKKAKAVDQFWRKRKCPGSEAVTVVKRLRMDGLHARSKTPAVNFDGNERAKPIRDVVLSSALSTPVCGENREFDSLNHTEWSVSMEGENNKPPMTEEVELVDTLEIKSGEREVSSIAPLHPRVTAVEDGKGRVTSLPSLQECSRNVTHVSVDNISTTEPSCKEPAVDKSDIYPAEEIQVNDVDLEAELDALERLTERIDGLKWQVIAMKKRGKRKRAAKLSLGLDGNKMDLRDELVSSPIVCGEPPVKKMCVGKMEIPTERPLNVKDAKTSLADSAGSMEKCAGALINIPRMRGALNGKGQSQIATKVQCLKRNQETGSKRRRKNTTPTKIPVPLKAEFPEGPHVQISGNTGSEGGKGINLFDKPVPFELQEVEQSVPMGHQKKEIGGQRSRSETPSNVDPSSISKQEEPLLNSCRTVDKLKIEDTQSMEHMRLSHLSRETRERSFLASDSLPKAAQAGSDGLVMNTEVKSVAAWAAKMGTGTELREGMSGASTTSSSLPNLNRGEKESQLQVFDNEKGASGGVCGEILDKQQAQIQCNAVIDGSVPATTSSEGASVKRTTKSSGSEDLTARLHRSSVAVVDQRILGSPRTIPILTLAGQQPPLGNAGEVFRLVKDTDSTKCNQNNRLVSTEVHERLCAPMPTKVISGAGIIHFENNGKNVKQENDLSTDSLRCTEARVQSLIENPQSMCQQSKCTGVLEGLDKLKKEFHSASQRPFKTIQEQAAIDEAGIALWQYIQCGVQDPPTALTVLKRLKAISEMLKITDQVDDPVGNTKKVILRAFNSEELCIGLYKTEAEAIAACSMISRCQKAIREFISTLKVSSTPTMELAETSRSGEKQPSFGQCLEHHVPSTSKSLANNRVQNGLEVMNIQTLKPVETVTASQNADQPEGLNCPGVHTVTHSALPMSGAGQVSPGVPISEQWTVRNQVQDVSGRFGGFTDKTTASLLQASSVTQPPQNQGHHVTISPNISSTDVVRRPVATPNNIIVLDDDDDEDACRIMPSGAPVVVNSCSRTSRGNTLGQAGSVHSVAFPQVRFGGPPRCGDDLQCHPQATGVTGSREEVPGNGHTGEVGRGSMSAPTNMTESQISTKRLYKCCMGTEATKLDYALIRALQCDLCDWLMHTECAIMQRKLALRRFHFNGEEHEQIIYTCNCNKAWAVLPSLLNRIKYFLDLISRKQTLPNSQAGRNLATARDNTRDYLNCARELLFKMQQMLQPTQSPILRCIHTMVTQMLFEMYMNPNAINIQVFIPNIDKAVHLIKGMWIPRSRTMLPTA